MRTLKTPTWLMWGLATAAIECCAVGLAILIFAVTPARAAIVATAEGLALGFVQMAIMRHGAVRIPLTWVYATLAGTIFGRGLEYFADTSLSGVLGSSNIAIYALCGALLGVGVGTLIAIPQWLVLRGHVSSAFRWVVACEIVWAIALPVMLGVAQLVDLGALESAASPGSSPMSPSVRSSWASSRASRCSNFFAPITRCPLRAAKLRRRGRQLRNLSDLFSRRTESRPHAIVVTLPAPAQTSKAMDYE